MGRAALAAERMPVLLRESGGGAFALGSALQRKTASRRAMLSAGQSSLAL